MNLRKLQNIISAILSVTNKHHLFADNVNIDFNADKIFIAFNLTTLDHMNIVDLVMLKLRQQFNYDCVRLDNSIIKINL